MLDTPTNWKTLKIYWQHWVRHPWLFGGNILFGASWIGQTTLAPLFIVKAIGQAASHHPVNNAYFAYAAVSLLGGALLWYITDHYISNPLLSNTMRDLYDDSFKQLVIQDYEFFADNFGGSLVTQANRFVKSYELFHITFFYDAIGQIAAVLLALVIMTVYSTWIGVVIGLLWIGSVIIIARLVVNRAPVRRAAVALESQQTGELADVIGNALTVKTFAAEQYEVGRYGNINRERGRGFVRSWNRFIRNNLMTQALCGVLQIALFVFGIHAVENGTITIATFLLFQVYVLLIINSITRSSLIVRHLEGVLGDSHEMTLLFEREPAVRDPQKPEKAKIKAGLISLNSMRFDYNEDSKRVLFDDFNLTIQPGERVGLVGPSGGGKTTITKLLLRFMDVRDGSITIDGQDIRNIRQQDLHQAIAYVPQEPLLFHRSLYDNISYGRSSATNAEVLEASKQAHADDFITTLPKGYDTLVGERGIKLSGGQRQRVAIARAMLKDAPILVLDEATSALDSESEKYIQKALWKLMEGRTTIVIAHRLSTIQHLDRIVVLDKGTIIEQGTHKQLLANRGLYAKLWSHQSGGFLEQ